MQMFVERYLELSNELKYKKGESGASSSSSSDRIKASEGQMFEAGAGNTLLDGRQVSSLQQTLDFETIRIEQEDLHEISKSSREY